MNVIDDFLPPSLHNIVKEEVLGGSFPWFFRHTVAYSDKDLPHNFQFTHSFYRDDRVNSDWYRVVEPMMFILEEKLKIKLKQINRIKANLTTQNPLLDPKVNIHQDLPTKECGENKYMTLLYYVNDSDGDTLFSDETKQNIIDRVTPKENRAVWFDSRLWHASSPPVENKRRVVINFILEIEDESRLD